MRGRKVIKWVLAVETIILIGVIGVAWWQEKYPKEARKLYYNTLAAIDGGQETEAIEEKMQQLGENNPEAKEFVDNFVNRTEYLGKEIDLSMDMKEGEVPLLLQWDMRWGYESFGSSNIGLAGCGPTCMSMAYLFLTEDLEGNPKKIADFCSNQGFYTHQGTSWDFWTLGAKQLGLEGKELPLDEWNMKSALDEGGLIVCSMWPGDFTTSGHYILIRGYNKEGFLVNDPNSREKSDKVWSYDALDGQIRNLWKIMCSNN